MTKIKILGTEYEVLTQTAAENSKLENANGLCEFYTKQIIVDDLQPDRTTFDNLDAFKRGVLRHEVMHAFFGESGLRNYAEDEVLVDWMAAQFPKIAKVFKELGVEE
jgi:hypothetical protein